MTVKRTVSVLAAAVLMAACASQPVPILLDGQQSPSTGAINASTTEGAVVHELQSTRWVPVTIDSQPITLAPQQREPFIVLQTNRVSGYGGCNRLSGGYEHSTSALKFTQVATTRMACEQGSDIEQSMLKVLESTAAWRIAGDKLELLDNAGNVLAGFAARNL
jgi:copper homeostasis protein (lipoprotein)